MLKRISVLLVVTAILVLGSGLLDHATTQDKSGCVTCHTDEAVMKSLFKAPKIEGAEGEG
jgi:cytochrome c553